MPRASQRTATVRAPTPSKRVTPCMSSASKTSWMLRRRGSSSASAEGPRLPPHGDRQARSGGE
eukprot:8857280-Alexandrium_andersonii.AAC.1